MVKKIKLGNKKHIEFELDGVGCGKRWVCSNLEEICPVCGKDCYGGCEGPLSREVEAPDDMDMRYRYNTAIKTIESLLLAHAVEGIDVTSKGYVEGIKTTLDALFNNIYE